MAVNKKLGFFLAKLVPNIVMKPNNKFNQESLIYCEEIIMKSYSPGPQPGSLSSENISLVPIASNLSEDIRADNKRKPEARWQENEIGANIIK